MNFEKSIPSGLSEAIWSALEITGTQSAMHWQPLTGGSINDSYRLTVNSNLRFFVKINEANRFPKLFETERMGLDLLRKQGLFRIPLVHAVIESGAHQAIIMEWIDVGIITNKSWKSFGEQLAALHEISQDSFGLSFDNFMGSVVQRNPPSADWINFFVGQRLQPLIRQAVDRSLLDQYDNDHFEHLFQQLNSLFPVRPPALLHGDLWNGNFICDQSGSIVLIDPAVYFGDPGMDLGLTTLFGGFDAAFYEAYHRIKPFDADHTLQWRVCNLYPLLVHLLLFGAGYREQIRQVIRHF